MRKQMTEAQFQHAIKNLDVGEQTLLIAHGVLVQGMAQTAFIASLGISRGAVSQAVRRVWSAFEASNIPDGHERIEAILPARQAYIVRKWAAEAAKKRNTK